MVRVIPIYDSSVQLYCPSLVCTPTFISRPSISREGEKKKERKERKGKQGFTTERCDGYQTHDNPHLSTTLRLLPRLRAGPSEPRGGRRERKKKKKEEQRLDHDSLDMARLSSTTSFYPLLPSPSLLPSLPYPYSS